jgi:ParB family transcriptional regulator, chromosome partitioning protein
MASIRSLKDTSTATVIPLHGGAEGETASRNNAPVEMLVFADLYLSDLNPRSVVDEAGILALAENIRKLGLIQNLAGLQGADGKTGIVAGGRRWRALALLQDDPRFAVVPVRIAPDAETALLWASSENHQRVAPNPADEVREYATLRARGSDVPEIALVFGVSEKHVYRRLALAGLAEPVLAALKAGEISLAVAGAFTIADDAVLAAEVLARARQDRHLGEAQVRRMLKPGAVRSSDRRAVFVGEEAYRAAGGRIGRDLFSEDVTFDDAGILDAVFAETLAGAAEALREAEGWAWAVTSLQGYVGYQEIEALRAGRLYRLEGVLSDDEAARYDDLSVIAHAEALDAAGETELAALQGILDGDYSPEQKAVSGVLVYVRHDGSLGYESGLVRPEDKAAAIAAGLLTPSAYGSDEVADAPKPVHSAALVGDLNRIATGARQHAGLRDPDLILALLAFDLSGRMGHRHAFGLRKEDVPNEPTTGAEGYTLDARLTTEAPAPEDPPLSKDPCESDLASAFKGFRKKGAAHVRDELIRHLATLLTLRDPKLAALLDKAVKTNAREVWTPTAVNYFARVNGAYLTTLWSDLLALNPDHPSVTTFVKLKKAEKVAKLDGLFNDAELRAAMNLSPETEARIAAWLPEGLA